MRGNGWTRGASPGTVRLSRSVVVAAPRERIYSVCRHPEALGGKMARIVGVEPAASRRHRWCGRRAENGETLWATEATGLEPPARIAWRLVEPADAEIAGELRLRALPGERTEITLVMTGTLGAGPASPTLGETGRMVEEYLLSFKSSVDSATETTPSRKERRLDAQRAASMADEGGAAAARIAGRASNPPRRAR